LAAGPAGAGSGHKVENSSRPDLTVVVVEKGSEGGAAHILSGAVIDPIGLDRPSLPDWRSDSTCPIKQQVVEGPILLAQPEDGDPHSVFSSFLR